MKNVVKVLKPTLFTTIIFLFVLLIQVVFCSSTTYSMTGVAAKTSTSSPVTTTDSNNSGAKSVTRPRSDLIRGKTRSSYGMGAPIRVTHNGAATVDINWSILGMNLAFCYLFASLVSLMLTEATQFRRPVLVYGSVTGVIIAAAFGGAVGLSKWYWGYYLSRPGVLKEINEVTAVSAVIPVQTESDKAGNRRIVVQGDYPLADRLARAREGPYYCLSERLLLALEERQLLVSAPTANLAHLPDLFPLIRATGILATPEKGYNDSDLLHGIVVDAVDKSGRRLVFFGLQGM